MSIVHFKNWEDSVQVKVILRSMVYGLLEKFNQKQYSQTTVIHID